MAEKVDEKPLSMADRVKQSAMKSAVKSFLPMITPQLGKVDDFMKTYLDKIDLQPWETKAAIMAVMAADEKSYILTCTFADDVLKRVISKISTVEFLQTLIKQI
jgi:hypothetical protein